MKCIQSQYITVPLTHVTELEDYHLMVKNGIKVKDMGDNGLIYKPPGFWISIDGDWERWCTAEGWGMDDKSIICKVKIKAGLNLLKISSVLEANNLIKFLVPDMPIYDFDGFTVDRCDLLNITHYMVECSKNGTRLTARMLWKNVLDNYDGVYYENSMSLHMHSMFNAWDASSIVIFDSRNVEIFHNK